MGLDSFGPLYIRNRDPLPLSVRKAYGVIFTYLVSPAIYILKLLKMCRESSFFSRLFALIDDGHNFTSVPLLLGRQIGLWDPRLNQFVTGKGTNWHFIRAYCPWQGIVYERLIALLRNALFSLLVVE